MKYRAKPVPVVAIQLDMPITYERWGRTQSAKPGDWMLLKGGETYTCEQEVFAETYRPLPTPAHYYKHAEVMAEVAAEAGAVKTLEGVTVYKAGDYLVRNPGGDLYAVEPQVFERLYEPVPIF